jgi:hypothetical protein
MAYDVDIRVVHGDILTLRSHVLALKYAQANYGVDRAVMRALADTGWDVSDLRPEPGSHRLLRGVPGIASESLLLVGVVPLYEFGYGQIRDFARRCLEILGVEAPEVETLTVTLHGAGYGLDEVEACASELAGFWDALSAKNCPTALKQICVVEKDGRTCQRLQSVAKAVFPLGRTSAQSHRPMRTEPGQTEGLRTAGYESDSKPHAFVAMPFREDMDDVYHYGIQTAVKKSGFLCERADLSAFTGDVMQWVKERIDSATLVVADLTGANPNVYLEVGYAWGRNRPTILIAKDAPPSQFDARGHRCLVYKRIQDLESMLATELKNLSQAGRI